MPDFKPLPKPISSQKPLKRPPKEHNKPSARVVKPKVVKKPHNGRIQAAPPAYRPKYVKKPALHQRRINRVFTFVRKKRLISLAAALVLAVSTITLLVWSMTGSNALALYLGEEHFAYIAFSHEIDENTIMADAVSRLELRENASVLVNEQLTVRPASSSARNILPYSEAIEQLADSFTFSIIGTAIEINGNRAAGLRSQAEAEEVLWNLQEPFLRGNREDYYSIEFLENVNLVEIPVEENMLATINQAINALNRTTPVIEEYIVQPGDTLGGIALRNNTTLARLYEDNPNLSPTTILQVGDALRVRSYRPYLSVRTVEVVTRTEPIPIENNYLVNPAMPANFEDVLQEGTEGLRQIVVHITRENAVQIGGEQEIHTTILEDMEEAIIEIGPQ